MVGRAALDVASVQLVDVPQKAWRLFNLLDQVSETNICAFPFSVLSLSLSLSHTHTHTHTLRISEYDSRNTKR